MHILYIPFSGVNFLMLNEGALLAEGFATFTALIRAVWSVNYLVLTQI